MVGVRFFFTDGTEIKEKWDYPGIDMAEVIVVEDEEGITRLHDSFAYPEQIEEVWEVGTYYWFNPFGKYVDDVFMKALIEEYRELKEGWKEVLK